MIPGPWIGLVLALAAFRLTRLFGWDDFPPILRLRDRTTGKTVTSNSTGTITTYRRPVLAKFVQCPYCIGWWISLGVYTAWLTLPTATVYTAAPFALSAAVGIIARQLDP